MTASTVQSSRAARVIAVSEAMGRDLLRRRLAMGLLAAIPGLFYLSVFSQEIPTGQDPWTLNVGTIGIAWSVGGGAFFLSLAAAKVDRRLIIAGHRRLDLYLARLAFLLIAALLLGLAYAPLLIGLSGANALPLLAAIVLTALLGTAFGLALGSVLPRELEGTLAIVLVIGIQSSTPASVSGASVLPFYGPMKLILLAWTGEGTWVVPVVHSIIWTTVFLCLAIWGWRTKIVPFDMR